MSDTVLAWDVIVGGELGATLACPACAPHTPCGHCHGSGRTHRPYRLPGGGTIGLAGANALADVPVIERGVLHFRHATASLSPIAVLLLEQFIGRPGRTVTRDELVYAVWPDRSTRPATSRRNGLDVHIGRVRAVIEPLGLTIETIPTRGYRLMVP